MKSETKSVMFTGLNFDEVEKFVGGDVGKNAKGQTVVAGPEGAIVIKPKDCIINEGGVFYVKQ